jgi:CO/xanthine dehydrogenase FAD-binding subunit
MKPAAFRYFAPKTVAEVIALLDEHGADARVLAGGQSLVPMMNLRIARPAVLIDLNRCAELSYVERRGNHLAFGPMTRQIDAMKSAMVRKDCPLVSQALEFAGPVAVRSRATVGGTLAHADRVAELSAVAIALDAVLVIEGSKGRREVGASDFFLGDLTTAIEPGELLREARFPVSERDAFSIFSEVSVRQEGVAVVGLAAHFQKEAGRICKAAFAAMGVEASPVRLRKTEAAVVERRGLAGMDEIANIASGEVDPMTDPYATGAYRKHVVGALVKKALHAAMAKAMA